MSKYYLNDEAGLSKAGNKLYQLINDLYPICRSITGKGVRQTLDILSELIPLNKIEVPSGTKAFDWELPDEWNIRDAWIKNSKGEKILDFNVLNLHVLNYSTPVNETIQLEELKKHLFTLPEQPNLVPYRTSYHSRQWGFCMSHNQMMKLPEEEYSVYIDSTIKPGSLTYGEYFIEGELKDEVLITCHVCHPSLCNDNLSGNVIAAYLAQHLSGQQLKYSYRFLFIPGTIGSITWLSQNEDKLDKIKHGLVLNLLGDSSNFYYKRSRRENTEIDHIMEFILDQDKRENTILDYSPWGYDERQFCSPGINLPVGRLSRKPHSEFPEYHTSADNLDFVQPEYLAESIGLLQKAIFVIENNDIYINQNPKCEPQLGKRGLYKSVGGQRDQKDFQIAILWILNYSDGKYSLLDIAKKSGLNFQVIVTAADELLKAGLLKNKIAQDG
ncbi:MAG: DUF4910 domain-containing protein [Bacteroidales bacterium]|nr:DUF4910 domain-containing protein [Bacteroidales bacterium]MCF8405343.1 DUF4910 domain-containing protein [Bacteroidales bacterium]